MAILYTVVWGLLCTECAGVVMPGEYFIKWLLSPPLLQFPLTSHTLTGYKCFIYQSESGLRSYQPCHTQGNVYTQVCV